MPLLFKNFLNSFIKLPRSAKTLIAISLDFLCCNLSVWIAYYLRLGNLLPLSERGLGALAFAIIISFPIFSFFGLYKTIFRYSGLYSLIIISKAISVFGVIYISLISIYGINGIPRTIGFIQPLVFGIFIIIWRILARFTLRSINSTSYKRQDIINAFVYGSGKTGRQLVKAIQESSEISIKGFLDDDVKQQGCLIDGKTIYSPNKLNDLIKQKKINLILLAMPSIKSNERYKIIKKLIKYKVAVRTIPDISDLAKGKNLITDFLELNTDDLLGRIEVQPFESLMSKNITSKTILVTGAGGSIGSELCRQIIKLEPKRLLLLEISEFALYSIHYELEQIKTTGIEMVPLIGSIQDIARIKEIIEIWKPATIYHAAAYKHVPIVEHNLIEGLKNNVFGTYNLAKLSIEKKVSNFVFISTDKAVRPTNIMGATKRLAELCLQSLNQKLDLSEKDKVFRTKFSIVRFGNVIDSSGSVIPKFREQIRAGGPITLTHREITRYFMTIPEAAQLVIQAGAMAKGGDVFVLDMGDPIKIYDLAERMIQLSGLSIKNIYNPKGDIKIIITGLRPGEKLYEELLISENPVKTKHPKIFRSNEPFIKFEELDFELNKLSLLIADNDFENIFNSLKKIITEYSPNGEIVDHTFLNK